MSEPKKCGTHTTIASNEAAKLTQCTCGAYHLSLLKRGLSLQLGADELRKIADTLGLAVRVADVEGRCASLIGEDVN
ncbi:MAG: hypothetical protein MUF64_00890 [Polyangiaceae bacterium]|jgi:hypothetical protein|nr:hypothetical protein [Polyangiaceae bacterium]